MRESSRLMRPVASPRLLAALEGPTERAKVKSLGRGQDTPDRELVHRAQQGDRWAEEAIYRRYVQFVGSIALRLLRARSDAEDVVQDTFAIALEQLGSLRDGEALRPWL